MKKWLCFIVSVLIIITFVTACAEGATFEIANLSIEELQLLRQQIDQKLLDLGAFYIDIGKNDKGSNVLTLQERLISLGYLNGDATGKWDGNSQKVFRTFEKVSALKQDGLASVADQQVVFSEDAISKPTPTPTPTPKPTKTPKPTATPFIEPTVPIELTGVRVGYDLIGTPVVYISVKNLSKSISVIAFTFCTQCYDAYGNVLSAYGYGDSTAYWLWQENTLKPGKKWSSNRLRWALYGYDTAYKIETWLYSVQTSDNRTILVPTSERSNNLWVWTKY